MVRGGGEVSQLCLNSPRLKDNNYTVLEEKITNFVILHINNSRSNTKYINKNIYNMYILVYIYISILYNIYVDDDVVVNVTSPNLKT